MENYKQASKQRLRFATEKGPLSAEQLWDLDLKELNKLAVSLDNEYEKSGEKNFLSKKSEKDKTAKLKFDIVIDIMNTKQEENQKILDSKKIKEHNEKIDELIEEKKEGALRKKSVKELEGMRL
jgi:hypothetical protein